MIGMDALISMQPGMRLVYTTRGGIINKPALLPALTAGQAASAALFVFSQETPDASGWVAHPEVITTPHTSAQTVEARAAEGITGEVLAVIRGQPLNWKAA